MPQGLRLGNNFPQTTPNWANTDPGIQSFRFPVSTSELLLTGTPLKQNPTCGMSFLKHHKAQDLHLPNKHQGHHRKVWLSLGLLVHFYYTTYCVRVLLGGVGGGGHTGHRIGEARGQLVMGEGLDLSTTWVLGTEIRALGLAVRVCSLSHLTRPIFYSFGLSNRVSNVPGKAQTELAI